MGFILQGCNDVQWSTDGPMGYGWYCQQYEGSPTYTEPSSGNNIDYSPDLYNYDGTDNWVSYADSCIHLNCGGIGYNKNYRMWQCLDDMSASDMNPWDLAWAASQGGHVTYASSDNSLFANDGKKHNGYFSWDGDKHFDWDAQWDGNSNEVEYTFSNNDDGTYTMWVDGGGKEGYYKIYNMCEEYGSKCWIQFDCLKNDKEFSDDC